MAIVDLVIVPLGTGSTSLSKYVADCHKVLENYPSLKWVLNSNSTSIEGDLVEIINAILRMHEIPFENGAMRVSTSIRIDDRRDKKGSISQKIESVMEKM